MSDEPLQNRFTEYAAEHTAEQLAFKDAIIATRMFCTPCIVYFDDMAAAELLVLIKPVCQVCLQSFQADELELPDPMCMTHYRYLMDHPEKASCPHGVRHLIAEPVSVPTAQIERVRASITAADAFVSTLDEEGPDAF